MKQSHPRKMTDSKYSPRSGPTRLEMLWPVRSLLILLLIILLAAVAVAAWSVFRPVIVTWPVPVIRYNQAADINYIVKLKESTFLDQSSQGMDLTYMTDYVDSINPVFTYQMQTNRDTSLSCEYEGFGTLRIRDAVNPAVILFEKKISLSPKKQLNSNGRSLQIEQALQADLADYQQLITDFQEESDIQAVYELAVGLDITVLIDGIPQAVTVHSAPALTLPLALDTFMVTRQLPDQENHRIWQAVSYQLILAPLPLWVHPLAAGSCLTLLVLVLVFTKNRRKRQFNKVLRKMLRAAKGRLMLIGNKAWEPEWCIIVTNYQAMIRTARKLKHPVFCYVDRFSTNPTAYFYVYYGENNYCYQYSEFPAAAGSSSSADTDRSIGPDSQTAPVYAEQEEIIPVLTEQPDFIPENSNQPGNGGKSSSQGYSALPDNPELSDEFNNPEIVLARLKYAPNHRPY